MEQIDVKQLFLAAAGQEIALEEALYAFSGVLTGNFELRFFFENPLLPPENKKKLVAGMFPDALPLFKDLINLLIDEGMEKQVVGMAEAFARMVSEKLNIIFVNVRSAYPLSEEEKKSIEKLVGSKMCVRVEIDPSLIGGFSFHTEDGRFFDASLQGSLDKLKKEIIYGRN